MVLEDGPKDLIALVRAKLGHGSVRLRATWPKAGRNAEPSLRYAWGMS